MMSGLFWFDPGKDAVAAEVAYVARCRTAGVRSQRAVATPSGRYVLPADGRWWRLYGAMVRCHRDLNGNNVVLDPAGTRWLVDWDNYGPLEPWRELGALLVEHAGGPAAHSGLAAAYREAGGPIARSNDFAAPAGGTLFATGLAIWLNFLAEQARSVLDGEVDAEQGAWSATRVAGLIGPFPSVPELDAAAGVVHAALSGS